MGKTLVDVGSWFGGSIGVFLSEHRNIDVVYAIEPEPANYVLLVKYCQEMRQMHEGVKFYPLPFALSKKTAVQTLHLRDKIGSDYSHVLNPSLKKRQFDKYPYEIQVVALTWNDFIRSFDIRYVDLCYIDVEGAEEDILEGMNIRLPTKIFVSHYHSTKYEGVKTREELQKQLKSMGYKIIHKDRHRMITGKRK